MTSQFDDAQGLLVTFGASPGTSMSSRGAWTRVFVTTPGMLAVVNSVVLGVISGVVVLATGASQGLALGGGAVAFLLGLGLMLVYLARFIIAAMGSRRPAFPGSSGPVTGA